MIVGISIVMIRNYALFDIQICYVAEPLDSRFVPNATGMFATTCSCTFAYGDRILPDYFVILPIS